MNREHDASRRNLLKGGAIAAVVATTPFLGTLQAFAARNAQGRGAGLVRSSYGPLRPTKDLSTGLELLQLPDGFQYKSFSWTGDLMENGQPAAPPTCTSPAGSTSRCVPCRAWAVHAPTAPAV